MLYPSRIITRIFLCVSIICILADLTLAQQDFQHKAYLVENQGLFHILKDMEFHHDSVKLYKSKFPQLVKNQAARANMDRSAGYNSCLLLYFEKSGNTVPAKDVGISTKMLVLSNESPVDTLNLVHRYGKECSLVSLSQIGNEHRKAFTLQLALLNDKDEILDTLKVPYDFLPGNSKEETTRLWNGAYEENDPFTKYNYVHRMVRTIRDPMYLTLFPQFIYPNAPYGEPNHELYIMEGNFSMPFTIMQGRDDQIKFLRTASVSINPEFTWRITTEDSAPLFPLNTKVGLGFHKSILDKPFRDPKRIVTDSTFELASKPFKIRTISFFLTHYSNGQDLGAVLDSTVRVPDFHSGNFSVNHLRLRYMRSILYDNFRQVSWGGTMQYNIHGLDYEPDQEKRYGYLYFQGTLILKSKLRKRILLNKKRHSSAEGGLIKAPSLKQTTIRLDITSVLDDISDYEGYDDHPLRRLGVRLRFMNDPIHNRSVGWFTQFYCGRDYLNIRYNLITYSAMIGITFNFNKDLPSREVIKNELNGIYDDCKSSYRKNCFRGKFISF